MRAVGSPAIPFSGFFVGPTPPTQPKPWDHPPGVYPVPELIPPPDSPQGCPHPFVRDKLWG